MKKSFMFGIHQYAFEVEVEFGSFEDLEKAVLKSKDRRYNGHKYVIEVPGSFNEKMNQSGRRAPLLNLCLVLNIDNGNDCILVRMCNCQDDIPSREHVKSASLWGKSQWEGECWALDAFKDEIEQGLYPLYANWDGKTYLSLPTKIDGKWVTKYEQTDTYRY